MSYMESLSKVMQHEGADHHAVTPQSQVGPGSGYSMPQTAIHQPGTQAAAPNAGIPDVAKRPDMPHYAPPANNYQDVRYVNPQMGTYQAHPQMTNLAFLLGRG